MSSLPGQKPAAGMPEDGDELVIPWGWNGGEGAEYEEAAGEGSESGGGEEEDVEVPDSEDRLVRYMYPHTLGRKSCGCASFHRAYAWSRAVVSSSKAQRSVVVALTCPVVSDNSNTDFMCVSLNIRARSSRVWFDMFCDGKAMMVHGCLWFVVVSIEGTIALAQWRCGQ